MDDVEDVIDAVLGAVEGMLTADEGFAAIVRLEEMTLCSHRGFFTTMQSLCKKGKRG